MSYSTKPVFLHSGNWSDESRAHPAMKWMEDYTRNIFDDRAFDKGVSPNKHHTQDMQLQKADGAVIKGVDAVWKEIATMYAPFAGQKHIPVLLACWETEDGWTMLGLANMYFRLHQLPEGSETDPEGGKWHGHLCSAFQFDYVKDGSGDIKLKETKIFSDATPALKVMLQNGMLNGEQLAGMVKGS